LERVGRRLFECKYYPGFRLGKLRKTYEISARTVGSLADVRTGYLLDMLHQTVQLQQRFSTHGPPMCFVGPGNFPRNVVAFFSKGRKLVWVRATRWIFQFKTGITCFYTHKKVLFKNTTFYNSGPLKYYVSIFLYFNPIPNTRNCKA
jgi:hypothetical protein